MQSSEIIRTFLLTNIPKYPTNIVAITAAHFKVSRVTVHRHLTWLLDQGKITKSGVTRQIHYALSSPNAYFEKFNLTLSLQEGKIWKEHLAGMTSNLNQ